ncbi:MAG TPA: EAL domain-containing protein [Spirochaetia bacterium]|nr:EAL domain-containing protein [Spirochaetia bacterium]
MKPQDWVHAAAPLDYAFQPIVSIHSGVCLGYEALLRDWDAAGFSSIHAVFDAAHADNALFSVELALREKAVRKFQGIPFHRKTKLFFNIDNRVLSMPDYSTGATAQILRRHGLHPDTVVFELSEKHDLSAFTQAAQASLMSCKRQAYKIAIDDFGTGYSGLQLLYNSEPDFIKIDRFFIADMAAVSRKRLFAATVLNLAHTLGIMVIAEGVETASEYSCRKDIGCDFIKPRDFDTPQVLFWIRGIIEEFQRDVLSLYDPPDRHQGFVVAPDRDGIVRRFPLLGASAAVLHVPEGRRGLTGEAIGAEIARLKKDAKHLPERMAAATLGARASLGESA